MGTSPGPRVVIVGAGFAGISAAKALAKSGAMLTLVDRNIYSTFQPLLYQVATGGLNPGDISYPVRSLTRNHDLRFRRGEVKSFNTEGSEVVLDDGTVLPYDYLLVTTGASVNFFGIPGAAENSFTLYRRRDAIALRDAVMGHLERLAAGKCRMLGFVIIGGGATGVEMAGTLAELRTVGLGAAYPEIDPSTLRVDLIEQGDALLAPFDSGLRDYALSQLEHRGVDVHFGTSVTAVGAGRVDLGDGGFLDSDVTIWAAGVTVESLGLPRGKGGRILVGPDLRVVGFDRVFAAGDVAINSEQPLAQLAQPAIQAGRHAANQIRRLMDGMPTEPLRYRERGTMATIGRRAAVVQLPAHIRLRGTPAWLIWLALHIVSLLGNRNRVSAMLNLSWRYLNWPRGSGVIVGDVPEGT